jgi:hypothetical protein
MRCERYWRDGILLVEQGRPDPHRESCLDCRREHEARGELVRAFKVVGARGGDPWWQARVWRGIADGDARTTPWFKQPWVAWASTAAAVCMLIAFVSSQWLPGRDEGEVAGDGRQPSFEIIPSAVAMRTTSAVIGDRVRIWVRATQEARIYRAEELLLRCTAATGAPATGAPATGATATATGATAMGAGCSRDGGGVVAEHVFQLAGNYQLVIAPAGLLPAPGLAVPAATPATPAAPAAPPEPGASLDRDLAAITAGGGTYQLRELAVR